MGSCGDTALRFPCTTSVASLLGATWEAMRSDTVSSVLCGNAADDVATIADDAAALRGQPYGPDRELGSADAVSDSVMAQKPKKLSANGQNQNEQLRPQAPHLDGPSYGHVYVCTGLPSFIEDFVWHPGVAAGSCEQPLHDTVVASTRLILLHVAC